MLKGVRTGAIVGVVATLVCVTVGSSAWALVHFNVVPRARAALLSDMAYSRLKAGNPKDAVRLYTAAIALVPSGTRYFNRGIAHERLNQDAEAREDFLRAHELEPTADTRRALCTLFTGTGHKENLEKIQYCSEVMARDAPDASVVATRAEAYAFEGRYDEALSDAEAAIALDPQRALARYAHVMALDGKKNAADGERDCAVLMKQKTQSSLYTATCAHVSVVRNDLALARERADQCLERDPTYARCLIVRAGVNQRERRLADAIADYRAAVAVAPDISLGWNNLAWLEVMTGDFAAARLHADRAVSVHAGGHEYGTRCFALVGLGLERDARADCVRALEQMPGNLVDGGMLAFIDRRYAEARRAWEEESRRDPGHGDALKPWLARIPAR